MCKRQINADATRARTAGLAADVVVVDRVAGLIDVITVTASVSVITPALWDGRCRGADCGSRNHASRSSGNSMAAQRCSCETAYEGAHNRAAADARADIGPARIRISCASAQERKRDEA